MTEGANLSEIKLDEREWPELRRRTIQARRGWEYLGMVITKIANKYGKEGVLDCVNTVMSEQAEKYVAKTLKKFNIKGNDCRTVAAQLMLADLIALPDFPGFQVVEDSPKRVVLRLSSGCPWSKDPANELPAVVCENAFGYEIKACEIINPKLKATSPTFMSRGDPYCEIVFELED